MGALLSLPGALYLAGLHNIEKQNLSTVATIIGFNLVMLLLLEVPLLSYTLAPGWTPGAVGRQSVGLPARTQDGCDRLIDHRRRADIEMRGCTHCLKDGTDLAGGLFVAAHEKLRTALFRRSSLAPCVE